MSTRRLSKTQPKYSHELQQQQHVQGRGHGFESGGEQFCERSEQKFFFDPPPLFGQWGGQNIA